MIAAFALVLSVGAYAVRWRAIRHSSPRAALSVWRLVSFLVGALALWAAVASPLSHIDQGHLTGHMIQHLLIMTLAAPLLLLGEPLRLLPERWRTAAVGWRAPHPALCWLAGTFIVIVWHVPRIFEFGMRWHAFQHATFFLAGLAFWLPVIQPWPTVAHWPRWSIPLYLFLATLPCDGLSAFLAFCGRVAYPHYGALHHAAVDHAAVDADPNAVTTLACHRGYDSAKGPVPWGVAGDSDSGSALEDQQRAGALMWFWVTIAYLVPATLVTLDLLSPARNRRRRPPDRHSPETVQLRRPA